MRDVVWVVDSGGPKESCIRCGRGRVHTLWEEAILRGKDLDRVKEYQNAKYLGQMSFRYGR